MLTYKLQCDNPACVYHLKPKAGVTDINKALNDGCDCGGRWAIYGNPKELNFTMEDEK